MNTVFIVSFVGKTKSDAIKQLAAITYENGGKWLVSKVNFIENQIAAVIKIEMPLQHAEIVKHAFINYPGLLVQIVDTENRDNQKESVYQLRLDATDRFGIVNEITQLLDTQGICILDMDCQRVWLADKEGINSSLFTANITLKLPDEIQVNDIVNELETLSEDTRVILLDR